MTQRWMGLIAVVGLIPLLLAMRPVDEALLAAASKGDLGEITRAVEKGADVNAADEDGITPLYRATEKGHQDAVALLLDKGANLKQETMDGVTPLHIAVERGHQAVVAQLLDKGADVKKIRTDSGEPPLFTPRRCGPPIGSRRQCEASEVRQQRDSALYRSRQGASGDRGVTAG
jgi:Ankyrin repeats (3 copies)